VHPDLVPEFAGNKFGDRRAVVVGDAAEAFTYAAMNAVFRQLIDGAEFLALAVNRTFKDADGGPVSMPGLSSQHWNSLPASRRRCWASRLATSSMPHWPGWIARLVWR